MSLISSNPRVSIVTPSYNQGKFIRQTIESVLNQSYPNIEYIIIDGGSTDSTLDILASYGNKIQFISEMDEGQTDAIIKGLNRSTGDILSFLNSDDMLLPGAIQRVVDSFVNSQALWLTGDYQIVDANGKQIQSFVIHYKRLMRRCSSIGMIMFANYIAQPSTFWSRELTESVGKFDVSLRYTMDYDYWLRAFMIAPPLILNAPLSAFRIHSASKGGVEFDNQFDEELEVLKRYTGNRFMIFCHKLHNQIIKSVYRIIK